MFARCDGAEDEALADDHEVASFPTVALYRRGARVETFAGRPDGVRLTAWVETHVPHFSVAEL